MAELVGVEPHVLRYWEREFRTIRPTKSAKGQRVYSRRDVENLMRVRELLYGQGFTIAGARKKLHEPASVDAAVHGEPPLTEPESPPHPGPLESSPPSSPTSAPRQELVAMRAEIQAFLAELDRADR